MTRYAYDQMLSSLIVSWPTGRGDVAATLSRLGSGVSPDRALDLASGLTALSGFLWRTYTHPANAAGDPEEPNTEAWQRAQEREAFQKVVPAIRDPELPDEHGMLMVSYSPIEESANQVGRVLHAISDPDLVERVATDVEAEIAAVEAAELGDLSDRARQAVTLSRADASPVQVQAADALLRADLIDPGKLFTDFDPTAAAVAAAHWLQAAADAVAPMAGVDPTHVIIEADDIQALPVATATLVLSLLDGGQTPHEVVTGLVAEAMQVAEGAFTQPDLLVERVAELDRYVKEQGTDDPAIRQALLSGFRLTPLDPARRDCPSNGGSGPTRRAEAWRDGYGA